MPVKIVTTGEAQPAQPTRRTVGLEPNQRAADGGPYRLLVIEDVDQQDALPAALAALPPVWLTEMQQAAIEGDLGWMATLIEQIRGLESDLDAASLIVRTLSRMVDNFEHDDILRLIERAIADKLGEKQ